MLLQESVQALLICRLPLLVQGERYMIHEPLFCQTHLSVNGPGVIVSGTQHISHESNSAEQCSTCKCSAAIKGKERASSHCTCDGHKVMLWLRTISLFCSHQSYLMKKKPEGGLWLYEFMREIFVFLFWLFNNDICLAIAVIIVNLEWNTNEKLLLNVNAR